MIVAYVFTSAWILEFVDAVWRYVVTYVTQTWFLDNLSIAAETPDREKPTAFVTMKAYGVAISQNVGSLAAGSLIILFARPWRILMNTVTAMANDNGPVGQLFKVICFPCVACHRGTLRPL